MVMHRCSGSEELYYWDINCFDGYKDCPNGEDESRANPICADRKHHNLNHYTVPYLTIFKLRLGLRVGNDTVRRCTRTLPSWPALCTRYSVPVPVPACTRPYKFDFKALNFNKVNFIRVRF